MFQLSSRSLSPEIKKANRTVGLIQRDFGDSDNIKLRDDVSLASSVGWNAEQRLNQKSIKKVKAEVTDLKNYYDKVNVIEKKNIHRCD